MSASAQEQVNQWAGMFDALSASYDQSGVPFFSTIAEGLARHLDPRPGERALDLGSGRGALTFPLAEAVGPDGWVDAVDIAPGMVERATETARERGLTHVTFSVGDARAPSRPAASYDVVGASLVLFFLPDPVPALEQWLTLLVPGGRLGIATFQPWSGTWLRIEEVFAGYIEDDGRPAPTQMPDVFGTDEGVEGLFTDAGVRDVRTELATLAIPFDDLEQWRAWSLGTAMRGLWMRTPEESHPEILERVGALLDAGRGDDGRPRLEVGVRYTLGGA